jgi:hypothetical protein
VKRRNPDCECRGELLHAPGGPRLARPPVLRRRPSSIVPLSSSIACPAPVLELDESFLRGSGTFVRHVQLRARASHRCCGNAVSVFSDAPARAVV